MAEVLHLPVGGEEDPIRHFCVQLIKKIMLTSSVPLELAESRKNGEDSRFFAIRVPSSKENVILFIFERRLPDEEWPGHWNMRSLMLRPDLLPMMTGLELLIMTQNSPIVEFRTAVW